MPLMFFFCINYPCSIVVGVHVFVDSLGGATPAATAVASDVQDTLPTDVRGLATPAEPETTLSPDPLPNLHRQAYQRKREAPAEEKPEDEIGTNAKKKKNDKDTPSAPAKDSSTSKVKAKESKGKAEEAWNCMGTCLKGVAINIHARLTIFSYRF